MGRRSSEGTSAEVDALLARSRSLGADRRVTNYGGGNTSCKTDSHDPLTGDDRRVLWIKGSGGDLGTLTHAGLAALDLERLRALAVREDEPEDVIAGLVPLCSVRPGPSPSIDTSMHALLGPAHVDHLHPDAVIALAASADGESLTAECFGGAVAWVPWRRPGAMLAREVAALLDADPALEGVVLGGHGLTSWAPSSAGCEKASLGIIDGAARFLASRGRDAPFGRVVHAPVARAERRRIATTLAPVIRGLCSSDARVIGAFDDSDDVLAFLAGAEAPRLAALGTSCPDHFLRTKVRPLWVDVPTPARLAELHSEYRAEYTAYYQRHAGPDTPPMRGADPAIVLVPGVGMWSFGRDGAAARIAGEFYRNAINVMRGAESVSRYAPIPEEEKFAIEYWSLEEAKLRALAPPKPLSGRIAVVTGAASGIGRAISTRLAAEGATVLAADLDTPGADAVAKALGGDDLARAVTLDVSDESSVDDALDEAVLAFGGVDIVVQSAGLSRSRPLVDTTVAEWDLQHGVMARGSFLVSRAAARVLLAQGLPADIVYIVSKNAVLAGPDNVAYGAAKADQAHQVRLLAAELGPHGIRVNGVNPDGVVSGSGIFASGWGADRAKLYGVPEEDLGKFYASRTLLKREVLPSHVAAAVFALLGGDLSLTTGLLVPVDGGLPGAFMR